MDINPLAISGGTIAALDARTVIDRFIGVSRSISPSCYYTYPTRYVCRGN